MGDSMSTIINATTTNGVVIQPDNSGSLQLATNSGTTALTIDTSQNVGIGITSISGSFGGTSFGLSNARTLYWNNASGSYSTSTAGGGITYWTDNNLYIDAKDSTSNILFRVNNATERMRIDSSGNLLLGTTSLFSGAGAKQSILWNPATEQGITIKASGTTFNGNPILFRNNADGTSGVISQGQTSVAYTTSSDYRLKENILPMTGALDTVAQLKPVTYKWKADGSDGQGFIAHELQSIVPDCVVGEKDAVETYTDEDGVEQTRIKPQGVDTSFLVATLTAAIQEQQTIINDLKARVEALEAK
jgi:hypothetical protein